MAARKNASPKTTATPPKRMGRPPKRAGELRSASLNLRLHPSERAELEDGAKAFGLTVTDFILAAAREKVARLRR